MQKARERGIKQTSMIDMGSIAYGRRDDKPQDKQKKTRKQESKQACKKARKKTNKQKSKQKVVSTRDKCRFGSNVHNFIMLKHGRHTSKQDSCMNM